MSMRTRLITLGTIVVLAVLAGVFYLLSPHHDRQRAVAGAAPVASTSLARIQSAPRIVFRNTSLGGDYGKVAMVALADPAGPRAVSNASCDRVYASAAKTLCLSSDRGLVTTYQAQVLGQDFAAEQSLPLAGIPSRARLSVDGTLAATTSFTAGDSYDGTGFSTRTVISTLTGAVKDLNLEDFTLIHDGQSIKPVDRNFWGVTFAADDNTFYATAAWGGQTWLAKGQLSSRTITTVRSDAECPSLSPDGTTIVYKKRNGQPVGHWRLASYSLTTGRELLLAETRNVDDQVAWLDDHTVLYGIARTGSQAAIDDIFQVPTDGSGSPKLLIAQAWSPAVVQ